MGLCATKQITFKDILRNVDNQASRNEILRNRTLWDEGEPSSCNVRKKKTIKVFVWRQKLAQHTYHITQTTFAQRFASSLRKIILRDEDTPTLRETILHNEGFVAQGQRLFP